MTPTGGIEPGPHGWEASAPAHLCAASLILGTTRPGESLCPSHLDTEPFYIYIIVGLPELDLHLRLIGLVVGSFNLNGVSGRADLCKRASMED